MEDQAMWQRTLIGVEAVYEQTPAELRRNLSRVTCEVVPGEFAIVDDLPVSLRNRFEHSTQAQLTALAANVMNLFQAAYFDLYVI